MKGGGSAALRAEEQRSKLHLRPYDPELLVAVGNAASRVCGIDDLNTASAPDRLTAVRRTGGCARYTCIGPRGNQPLLLQTRDDQASSFFADGTEVKRLRHGFTRG